MLYAGNRLVKHMLELGKSLKKTQRAIMLIAFQYNSDIFGKKKEDSIKNIDQINEAVEETNKLGVESWQVNLSIDKKGVSFLDHFKIKY